MSRSINTIMLVALAIGPAVMVPAPSHARRPPLRNGLKPLPRVASVGELKASIAKSGNASFQVKDSGVGGFVLASGNFGSGMFLPFLWVYERNADGLKLLRSFGPNLKNRKGAAVISYVTKSTNDALLVQGIYADRSQGLVETLRVR